MHFNFLLTGVKVPNRSKAVPITDPDSKSPVVISKESENSAEVSFIIICLFC